MHAGHRHERKHIPTPQPRVAGQSRDPSPAHTPTPHTPARNGRVQAGRAHKHEHAPTPQRAVAGRGCNPGPDTHPRTTTPARRCREPGGMSTQTQTQPNTSPRIGRAQPKPQPKHTHPHRTPEPEEAGYRRSAHTTTHAPKPQPRMVGCRPKPKPNPKHRKPQPGKEGRNHNPYPNTPTQVPSQGWRGYRNPNPNTTRTQTQMPHNNRKPSVHSPGTEAALAMQVIRPNEIRRPAVRLHPKASPLWDSRRSVQHPSTSKPQYQEHACVPWEQDTPGGPVNLQGSAQRRGRVQARGNTLSARQARHTGGDQPSRCCPGPLCFGGHQSGLTECKPPPLFMRGTSPVRHRGDARGNHGAPLQDQVHLPTYCFD